MFSRAILNTSGFEKDRTFVPWNHAVTRPDNGAFLRPGFCFKNLSYPQIIDRDRDGQDSSFTAYFMYTSVVEKPIRLLSA